MAHTTYDASSAKAKELRKQAGSYVRTLRHAADLTQREVAQALHLDYYTFISQLESGYGRVPPNLYIPLAKVLGVNPHEFTREMVKFYDPFTYEGLFGKHPYIETDDTLKERTARNTKRKGKAEA